MNLLSADGQVEWTKVIAQNRRTIFKIIREAFAAHSQARETRELTGQAPDPEMMVLSSVDGPRQPSREVRLLTIALLGMFAW